MVPTKRSEGMNTLYSYLDEINIDINLTWKFFKQCLSHNESESSYSKPKHSKFHN